jgi:hypothetical protein
VSKGFVVPECRVLEDEPSTRLAKTTPSFTLIAMTSYPPWRIHVAREAKVLLVRNEIWV